MWSFFGLFIEHNFFLILLDKWLFILLKLITHGCWYWFLYFNLLINQVPLHFQCSDASNSTCQYQLFFFFKINFKISNIGFICKINDFIRNGFYVCFIYTFFFVSFNFFFILKDFLFLFVLLYSFCPRRFL